MHKITFFPIGNGDCCMIDTHNGKKILFDYANLATGKADDLRINLYEALRQTLNQEKRNYFDIVGFTHADDDHIHGASDFFYFEHTPKYQDDSKIKINELWVPAAMILEGDLREEARIIRQEARYRLLKGSGIRVFSHPDKLAKWLKTKDVDIKDRMHLISDAGTIVPGFQKEIQGIEFFVHSPFAMHVDDGKIERNEASLILHITFTLNGVDTKFLLIGDSESSVLEEIVKITRIHNREDKLKWDIYDIPHHCSYLALNVEKGNSKTLPVDGVKWLLEQGNMGGILVSSSKVISNKSDDVQPPHWQAAECYREYAKKISGEFKVTMEFPSQKKPEKMVIEIDESGATLKKNIKSGIATIISTPAPRAGI